MKQKDVAVSGGRGVGKWCRMLRQLNRRGCRNGWDRDINKWSGMWIRKWMRQGILTDGDGCVEARAAFSS